MHAPRNTRTGRPDLASLSALSRAPLPPRRVAFLTMRAPYDVRVLCVYARAVNNRAARDFRAALLTFAVCTAKLILSIRTSSSAAAAQIYAPQTS